MKEKDCNESVEETVLVVLVVGSRRDGQRIGDWVGSLGGDPVTNGQERGILKQVTCSSLILSYPPLLSYTLDHLALSNGHYYSCSIV